MAETPATILFCGGGTVGHVAPSLAVAEQFHDDARIRCFFLCSDHEDEKEILRASHFPFATIPAATFPRGISAGLIIFPVLFFGSLIAAFIILLKQKPRVIFSKGGYVSVPVCMAAVVLGIPLVLHESDSVPGIGTSMFRSFARVICRGFPSDDAKEVVTGNPVRPSLLHGEKEKAKTLTALTGTKPVLLITGGSQGAQALNEALKKHAEALLSIADIIHLTGRGKAGLAARAGYWSAPFVTHELADLYALADLVITRGGASALSEIAAVQRPVIVIPLSGVAHDHQVRNAEALAAAGAAIHLPQWDIDRLPEIITDLLRDEQKKKSLTEGLHRFFPKNSAARIAEILRHEAGSALAPS